MKPISHQGFLVMGYFSQLEYLLLNGSYVALRFSCQYLVNLYKLNDFYAEIFFLLPRTNFTGFSLADKIVTLPLDGVLLDYSFPIVTYSI